MALKQHNLNEFIKNILRQASQHCAGVRKTLYHYTNADGIKGIINDGEIWGTHYKFTNDPTEIDYSYNLIIELLENAIQEDTDPIIQKYFTKYLEFQKNIFETIKKYPTYNIYLASFSEKEDLLSQWRGYGDNASGYSMGIDLYKVDRKEIGFSSYQVKKMNLVKVIYKEENQIKIILNYLDQLKDYIKEYNGSDNTLDNSLGSIYIMIFPLIACLMKDPQFIEEQEWRLIYAPLASNKNGEFETNYRISNKVITPFIKMNIKSENNLVPFNELIIGPRSDEMKARMGIERLLIDKGYKDQMPKIIKSNIPLT